MFKVNNNFLPTIQKYRYRGRDVINTSMGVTLRSLQTVAMDEARNQLNQLVYRAPLPRSVFDNAYGWTEERYLAMRRVGRVFRAIKRGEVVYFEGGRMAEVRVDRSDFETFYYAWILDRGADSINYTARPFWTNTVRIMRIKLHALGAAGLKGMRSAILEAT